MFRLARRALELLIFLFALYAFATVPLGKKTGLEHARAIFSTREAKEAGDELSTAGKRVFGELIEFDTPPYRGTPTVPPLGTSPVEENSNHEKPAKPSGTVPKDSAAKH